MDISRYNNFIDTVLRRINSHSRARNDPLTVALAGNGKKGNGKKDKEGGKDKKKKKKNKG